MSARRIVFLQGARWTRMAPLHGIGRPDRRTAPSVVASTEGKEKRKRKKKKEKKQITGENAVVSANRGEFENAPVRNDNSKGFTRSLGRAERKTGMKAGLSSDIRST